MDRTRSQNSILKSSRIDKHWTQLTDKKYVGVVGADTRTAEQRGTIKLGTSDKMATIDFEGSSKI